VGFDARAVVGAAFLILLPVAIMTVVYWRSPRVRGAFAAEAERLETPGIRAA